MPLAVHVDRPAIGRASRLESYAGVVDVASPSPASVDFATFAQEMIYEAFAGHEPEVAQFELSIGEYAATLATLQSRFVHHPESKRLVRALLIDTGCDPRSTYFGVPRLRSTCDGYLSTAPTHALRPHRDTWYAAPLAQLNLRIPVHGVTAQNALAFHPEYFDRAVPNDSAAFDYDQWDAELRAAATLGTESRPLPGLTEPIDLASSTVLVTPVGGVVRFSGHHLHSCVPNTSGRTRFAVDLRTVDVDDVRAGLGAHNVDSRGTGSSIGKFICAADFSPVPADVVSRCGVVAATGPRSTAAV